MKLFYPFLFAAIIVNGDRLNEEENAALQDTCGRKYGYHRKVINGELANRGDFPWAVSVYIRHLNKTTSVFDAVLGPGTIVSPRHIFAYNTISKDDNGNLILLGIDHTDYTGSCEGDHLVIPEAMNSRYDFGFEHFQQFDNHREFQPTISKITVINGCKDPKTSHVMVLELVQNLDLGTKIRQAACTSNSPRNWFAPEEFPVYGMNRQGILVSGKFMPINCTVGEPYGCVAAMDQNQGLCQGDFGGSAVANLEDRFTMLGLYASGNTRCRLNPGSRPELKFVNIGYLRKEICDVTGICVPAPPEDESEEPEETTEEPEETTTEEDEAFTRGSEEETTTEDDEAFTRGSEEETTTEDDEAFTRGGSEEVITPEEITDEPTIISVTAYPMPLETTTTPSSQRIGENGEVIVAETFPKQPLAPANCTGNQVPEVIIAERIQPMQIGVGVNGEQEIIAEKFEPMPLGSAGMTRGDRVRTVNININFL
ncbi:hypothetical protein CAEBREN_11536 [Caenorhabditis brenneri]|uniref:Peptidase S1 domain-containing protein n=1 Tax=Caenorhabditis brenneri TaxID=135651 RepID=G0M9C0_CAEBE|nr:hypothetical protein CAEBREN_11536 [Caenorhabditis brenneri]